MHILLTDILTCPACGPDSGLILLAERIVERRVLEGRLGCPQCEKQFPIRGGFADLRLAGAAEPSAGIAVHDPPGTSGDPATSGGEALDPTEPVSGEQAFRLAALMGVTSGPGYLLIVGTGARAANAIAGMLEQVEVIALDPALASWPEQPGVSRMAADRGLPFFANRIRAVALTPPAGPDLAGDAARVLVPGGRLVWEAATPGAAESLDSLGLRLVARQGSTLVAARG
jgi:uncharacterized protein YbaR (Trm112 family)